MSPGYRFKRGSKKKALAKPAFTLTIGRIYVVKGYHTGDFRAKCCDSLTKTARLKVTDAMRSSLHVDDEIEIPFVHAEFLPSIVEQFQKPIAERFGGKRDATYGG
jgi:hypothetical protein